MRQRVYVKQGKHIWSPEGPLPTSELSSNIVQSKLRMNAERQQQSIKHLSLENEREIELNTIRK